MRILQIVDTIGGAGGMQTYVRGIAQRLLRAGHDVAILHGDEADTSYTEVPTQRAGSVSGSVDWIGSFEPDVVHVHDRGAPAEMLASLDHPLVRSFHNFDFACSAGTKHFRDGATCKRPHGAGCYVAAAVRGCPHRFDPRPFVANYRRVSATLRELRGVRGIILHSEFVRSVALANGLAEESCEVIPPFVERAHERAKLSDTRVVAFVGRVVPDKGLDVLIGALSQCRDEWDELRVVGDGWALERCTRLARTRHIGHKIRFQGELEPDGVRRALIDARVLVVPSRWPEPFGIVGLEAMAHGRAVIGSDVGGIPEWLDHGETGLLVPPGDEAALAAGLVTLLGDDGRAQAMGREGWRRVGRFSPEGHVDKLVASYARATERGIRVVEPPVGIA